ncbi:hypothetical protein [Dactylosporangium salmoneum]|uniref:Uncharacterized protein n=1 Tax=Dactylosporangium salmoneum TaxID=53361 RepID=A0ABP5SCT1_9ACTN
MSRTWSFANDSIIIEAAGGAAGLGSGAHTILAYINVAGSGTGVIQLRAGTTPVRSLLSDSGKFFADGDFTGGPTSETGVWAIVGYSKAAGSATIRWHYWSPTTGTWAHSNGSVLGDPGAAIDNIWLGKAYNRGNFTGAAIGVWAAALTDMQVEAAGHTALQDWYDLNPAALWAFNQAADTDLVLDLTGGGADQTSIVNTSPAVGTDPPGWSYTISSGITLDLPIAVETSSALALGRGKRHTLGVAAESSTALTLGRSKARTLATATETCTALTLAAGKARKLAVAGETTTALPLGRAKRRTLPPASEIDAAVQLSASGGVVTRPGGFLVAGGRARGTLAAGGRSSTLEAS